MPTERSIRHAIRVLAEATDDGVILDFNETKPVYIVPAILENGRIEYQVSDGLPGCRSYSEDCYTYQEAKKAFDKVVSQGWPFRGK